MFLLMAAALAVEPTTRVTVEGTGRGRVEVSQTGKKLSLYVTDGADSFVCTDPIRESWRSYVKLFDAIVADAPRMPNADFGSAMTGFAAFSRASAAGYCNASATTRDGAVYLTFTYNRACFGSAGCNRDVATVAVGLEGVRRLSGALTAYLDGRPIDGL